MPPSELPLPGPAVETPSAGFFNSALMEIESYFDFPDGESKGSLELPRSRHVTPSVSPSLNPQFRPSSPGVWGRMPDSPEPGEFEPFVPTLAAITADLQAQAQQQQQQQQQHQQQQQQRGIAPLQISNSFAGQPSPPDSSGSSPDKYLPPGDISPLDSLISHMPSEASRTVHGQVTPPDDVAKSPGFARMPTSLVLPMRLISPGGSPELASRSTPPRQRASSISEETRLARNGNGGSGGDGRGGTTKRRRSSTGQSNRRQRRRSIPADGDPEVQEAKRRRFLERNRVAASKCRQKKKAWMQDLESDAREAQNMSKQLKACVGVLKEEILSLKNELLKHNTCECVPIRQYLSNEAMRLADGGLGKSTRTSDAPDFGGYTAAGDCKIHPALMSSDFDLDFVDDAEVALA